MQASEFVSHNMAVRCDRTCVVEISVDFRQTDRSLLYNAISHDASHCANKHVQTDTFGEISMIFPPGTITMWLAQSNDAININIYRSDLTSEEIDVADINLR